MYFSNFILLQQNGTRVSVIIPKEVIPVMEYLANPLTRKNFGIKGENILFYLPTRVGMLFQFSTMCWYSDLILVIKNNNSGLDWCSKNWFSSQTFLHKPKNYIDTFPFLNSYGCCKSGQKVSRSRCDLKFPERVHATNLRKHCATIAEVSNDIVAFFYFKLLPTYKTAILMKKNIVRNFFSLKNQTIKKK